MTEPMQYGTDRPDDLPARRRTRPAEAPATRVDDRSITQLVRQLVDESRTLVREEIALAKAEMREKLQVYERNLARVAIGGTLVLAAVLFVLWAVNTGLTALLATVVELGVAVWLAPLILGVILGLVGQSLVKRGTAAIKEEGVVPEKTVQSLRADRNWVKEQMRNGRA